MTRSTLTCPCCGARGRHRNPCADCRRLLRLLSRLHRGTPPCEGMRTDTVRLANIDRYAERAAEGAGLFGEGGQ